MTTHRIDDKTKVMLMDKTREILSKEGVEFGRLIILSPIEHTVDSDKHSFVFRVIVKKGESTKLAVLDVSMVDGVWCDDTSHQPIKTLGFISY